MSDSDLSKTPVYAGPARVLPMARWAMVLGMVGAATGWLGVGVILGTVGVILGHISLRAIKKDPARLAGVGYANSGITWGYCSWIVLIAALILMPPLGHRRLQFPPRASCAANITGIIKGFVVYASDNNNVFPTPGLPPADRGYSTALGTLSTATDPDAALNQIQTTPGAQGNPLSAMWMLVLRQQMMPKNMICKGDPEASATPAPTTDGTRYYLNPTKANQVSYSIAYPYASAASVGGWWKNTTLSDLPVITDMAPLHGTGRPKRDLVPAGTVTNVQTFNSGNHNGDGQEVGYADAHAEWKTTPLCGQGGESIWTVGTVSPPAFGTVGSVITGGGVPNYPPSPPAGSTTGFDTIMVPVRDLGSGAIK